MAIQSIGGTSFGRETWCVAGNSDRQFVAGVSGCTAISGSCSADDLPGVRYSCEEDALFRAIGAPSMESAPTRQTTTTRSTTTPSAEEPSVLEQARDVANAAKEGAEEVIGSFFTGGQYPWQNWQEYTAPWGEYVGGGAQKNGYQADTQKGGYQQVDLQPGVALQQGAVQQPGGAPPAVQGSRPVWPWIIGGLVVVGIGVGAVVLLTRGD